jgi:CBF/Mak21 family
MAYLKRLGICALQSSAPIAAGLLFLMSETYRARPKLLAMMTQEEGLVAHKGYADSLGAGAEMKDKEDQEGGAASHQLGNFEASKREPAFAASVLLLCGKHHC